MNFRVLAASAQALQRSNGNDFPHNAPRPEKGGGGGGGGAALLKEDGGAVEHQGVFVLQAAPIFRVLFIFSFACPRPINPCRRVKSHGEQGLLPLSPRIDYRRRFVPVTSFFQSE